MKDIKIRYVVKFNAITQNYRILDRDKWYVTTHVMQRDEHDKIYETTLRADAIRVCENLEKTHRELISNNAFDYWEDI